MLFPASASCTTHHDNLSHDWRTALLVPVTSRPRLNTLTRPLIIHPVTHVLSAIGVGLSALTIPLVTLPLTLVPLTSRPRLNTLTRPLIILPVTHVLPPIGEVACALAIHLVTLPLALGESNNALPSLSLMHHAS